MAGRRLTRKEIVQEDQVHSTINDIFVFLIQQRNLLLGALGGAVLLAAGIYYWADSRAEQQAVLQLAFAQAQEIYQAPVGEAPPTEPGTPPDTRKRYKTEEERFTTALAAFTDLKAKASGSRIGDYAQYYEALCQRGLGRTEEYLKGMEALAAGGSNDDIAMLAAYSLGDHFLGQGDAARAQAYLDKVLANTRTAIVAPDNVLNQLATYYEKRNDKAQAVAYLERLLKEYPDSKLKSQTEARLNQLKSADPQ